MDNVNEIENAAETELEETPETDLYKPIRENGKKRRRRRDKTLLTIGIVAFFFAGMIFSFWWNMSYWKRFSKLCSSLSEATTYAYKHDSAYVVDGSDRYKLDALNGYEVYQCVCVYGPGRERFSVPDGEGESVTITYGNGASLRLLELGEGDSARLYFCFFEKNDKSYIFSTNEIKLDYIYTRYLAPKQQSQT